METQRYYLGDRANVCYNKTGITYPIKLPVDFEAIVKSHVANPNMKWEPKFGWNNQPEVLTLDATEEEVTQLQEARLNSDHTLFDYMFVSTIWTHYGRHQVFHDPEDEDDDECTIVSPTYDVRVICEEHGFNEVLSIDRFNGDHGPNNEAIFNYRGVKLALDFEAEEPDENGLHVIRITRQRLSPSEVKEVFG